MSRSSARSGRDRAETTGRLSYLAAWQVIRRSCGAGGFWFLLLVFLLLNREDMRNRVIKLIGDDRITATTKAVDEAGIRISRYLRMQLILNAAFGFTLAAILALLGIPYALLLWGFVGGLMRYVPYVGTFFGLTPPLLTAIAFSDGWREPLQVVGAYIAIEIFFNTALEPHLFGRSLGISQVAMFSEAFWAFLWGPMELVPLRPTQRLLLVISKNVPQLYAITQSFRR